MLGKMVHTHAQTGESGQVELEKESRENRRRKKITADRREGEKTRESWWSAKPKMAAYSGTDMGRLASDHTHTHTNRAKEDKEGEGGEEEERR